MDFLSAKRRYLLFLGGSCLVALVLGFFVFKPSQALELIRYGGYWLMAGSVALFIVSLVQFIRTHRNQLAEESIDWVLWAIVAAVTILLLVHEPFGFKVLMDELVLAGTSMSMHLDREVFTPLHTHSFDGATIVMGGILDKRPYFFPFLLSLLHDLTGYRPENVFLLNGVLVFVLLGLVGHFASNLVNRSAGRLTVLLLAGLPLLALNATGGGFEILNLVMITLAMIAAAAYLEDQDSSSLNLLVLTGVLLAQTRYESVLYVLPIGIIVLTGWFRQKRVLLTWPVIVAPLLLVAYPLLNSVFNAYQGFWQLPEEVESPFSLSFVADNLSHAVAYFFSMSVFQSNSFLLSIAGFMGLVFMVVFLVRLIVRRQSLSAPLMVLALFGLIILGTFSILMCYHWGQLDQYVVSRLGLPLYLLLALAIPIALADFKAPPKVWNGVIIVAAIYAFGVSIPSSARAYSTERFVSYRQTEWYRKFILEHRDEGAFFVVPSPLVATVYRQSAASNSIIDLRAEELKYHLDRGTYTDVYVFQVLVEDITTGDLIMAEESVLNDEEFTLETLGERKFTPDHRARISRLVAIDPKPSDEEDDDPIRLIRRELTLKDTGDLEADTGLAKFLNMLP